MNTALGQSFANDVVNQAGANGANSSDPYSIPWTDEEEKRKRLSDAQIQRDNLLESMGDTPTMEDIVAWGEYDATIKQLTEELGLGPKEYTPGVEGGDIGDGKGGYDSVQNVAAPMNTPSNSSRNVAGSGYTNAGSSSGRYNNVQNVAAPMNTPSGGGHSIAGTGYTNVGSSSGRYNNVQNVAAPMSTPSNSSRSVAGTGYANVGGGKTDTALGQSFTNDVVNSAAANGSGGNGADYVNPKDYDSEVEYAKALMDNLRTQMQTGNPNDLNDFLFLNGYDMGAEGLGDINQYAQGVLGQTGMAVYAGELNAAQAEQEAEQQQNIAALSGKDDMPTMKDIEAAKQEAQVLLETPISELTLDELAERKHIELIYLANENERRKDDELENISKLREEKIQSYIDSYNGCSEYDKLFCSIRYGIKNAEEFAAYNMEATDWEENKRNEILDKYDIQYENEKKALEEEYEPPVIIDAMGKLVDYTSDGKKDDINLYINKALDTIQENGGALTLAEWPEKGSTGWNRTYVLKSNDNVWVEMEVLNKGHLYEYGGDKVGLLEQIDKLESLYYPPKAHPFNAVGSEINKELASMYSEGQILEPGDVRITIVSNQPFEWEKDYGRNEYRVNYFFRDSKLLYSRDEQIGITERGDYFED